MSKLKKTIYIYIKKKHFLGNKNIYKLKRKAKWTGADKPQPSVKSSSLFGLISKIFQPKKADQAVKEGKRKSKRFCAHLPKINK